MNPTNNYYSIDELCNVLSISTGTARNWIKRGKIVVDFHKKNKPFFSYAQISSLKSQLYSADSTSLKSRRNKLYQTGIQRYKDYSPYPQAEEELQQLFQALPLYFSLDEVIPNRLLGCILAECALQLFASRAEDDSFLFAYINGKLDTPCPKQLLSPLLCNASKADVVSTIVAYPALFQVKFQKRPFEDLLGLLYQSLQSVGSKKKQGAYFTPQGITRQITQNISGERILDPSCGTGSFLLSLCQTHAVSHLYGYDIDPISIAIVRINMALHGNCLDVALLEQHFRLKNTLLLQDSSAHYDIILGNPPWGSNFSSCEIKELKPLYQCFEGKNPESFCLFLEQGIRMLKTGGQLTFLLPEALLQVKRHEGIRRFLCQNTKLIHLSYLGNVFHGVQCPCIIITLQKTKTKPNVKSLDCTNAQIQLLGKDFVIKEARKISYNNFSFLADDQEYALLRKIEQVPCQYLKNNCEFALGIVTGDNRRLLKKAKTKNNEPILSGKELSSYHIAKAQSFIAFTPEKFQQCAPAQMYRAKEKLVYRFINRTPVVAYDNCQQLTLNSCNILIPNITDMDMKYIMALLNSTVLQFYFEKTFSTLKILRSQLEDLPLAIPSQEQHKQIVDLVDCILQSNQPSKAQVAQTQIDQIVMAIYQVRIE